jgi:putative flippase GtrA
MKTFFLKIYHLIRTNFQFIKFLIVGGINTLFGYLIYAFFVFLVTNPYVAVVLATIVAVLFNFRTYGSIVFKSKDYSLLWKFFAVYLFLMFIQMGLLKTLMMVTGMTNSYIAGAMLTLPMALLSFLLMRKFVFAFQVRADSPKL